MSDVRECHMCLMGGFQCQLCGRTLEAKHLARLERCAKKWAHTVVIPSCDGFRCLCCQRLVLATHYNENRSEVEKLRHAHDCDAAHILGLERESER